ncbi:MAG: type II toxin-antitoxin system HicA family toxin [Verrucomicrobia bacterium]|nr:type II toxin-antitoxin system HicA family toxin [Verrucomicrobiota bacterium]
MYRHAGYRPLEPLPRRSVLKPRKVVRVLERLGFVDIRQRGAHRQLRQADGTGTTVPFHVGRDIAPLLLRRIIKEIGVTPDLFLSRVRQF